MRVAIVGGGYSGTIAAVEAARALRDAEISLIDKAGRFAAGAAYSTRSPGHLLNVPARGMSALADDPEHFVRWAEREGLGGRDQFLPRREFGRYLREVLAGVPQVRRVTDEATSLEGDALALASGERISADVVLLAGGNYGSRLPGPLGERAIQDPWGAGGAEAVQSAAARGGEVLLVGTGLTMVDMAISLEEAGFAGRITACSRRGLVPRPHLAEAEAPLEREPPSGLANLVRDVRGHHPWRASVDGLRPHSRAIWRGLSETEKKRFLRHARPWWDAHRHRIAPAVGRRIAALREAGRLEVMAGRIAEVDGDSVTIRRRGGGELRRRFAAVINCTGPEGDVARIGDPLIRQLLASGRAMRDPLGQGLQVDERSRVLGAGESPPLYALGPLSRGAFWEIVAVPDIRVQARDVVRALSA
ncbi:MAG TPA: FAD/NAD(P)-binding protein [Salinarimonas sp.]|nr:FAD/NAD(P)-binding protein [Salinarimonas sp.]